MNPPQVFVLLMSLAAVSVTLSSGAADPVFGGANTAKIATIANSAMIPAYTVTDADGDTLVYTVTQTTDFDVESATGLVTTKNLLTDAATGTYDLIVSGGSASPVTGTITYTVFTDTTDPAVTGTKAATVAEDVSAGTDVISSTDVATILKITDADIGIGDGFTYELSGTDFKMDLFTGVTTTAGNLDFETTPSYTLTVTVKDSKRTIATGTLTITVTNIPVCNPITIEKKMPKDATVGTEVTTLSCSTTGTALVYAITAGNTNTDFGISTAAGVMTVINQLATVAVYDIKVTVTSGTETAIVDVEVSVIDNKAPVCSPSTITKNMADDAKVGTEVTTLSCTDHESQTLTYTILDGNKDDDFALDSSTGKMTVDKALDNSRTSSYVVKAAVVDTAKLTATTTTTINVQAASGAINIANHMYIVAGLILLMKYNFE